MKTPALLCLRFQALAEALKINSSVTSIGLISNDIGDEGVKAWCVEGSAESLNAAASHDVTFQPSCDSDKLIELSCQQICRC